MQIKELLKQNIEKLKKQNIEDSSLIAKELLSFILNVDKQFLLINKDKEIADNIVQIYIKKIEEILKGKPLQYIINYQEFMKLKFFVNEDVLIPQPDTEILVQNVIELCKELNKKLDILDLCTGSGAIAISLAKNLSNIKVEASDISNKAINIAKKNSQINKTEIKFIKSDLFNNINKKYDIIISNPPYIKTETIKTLSKQVQREPYIALNGGKDGLNFYRKIISTSYKYMKPNGYLFLEIGYDQKEEVISILRKEGKYKKIKVIKDLGNNDRCIISQFI